MGVKLKVSPASLNFGTVKIGNQKGPRKITVSNPDPRGAPGVTVLMEGVNGAASPFIVANGCNGPLPTGAKCSIGVTFKPTATGAFTATLTIIDNAQNAPQPVKLKGKGK